MDWWLHSPRVVERVSGDEWRRHPHLPPAQVLSSAQNGHGLPLPPPALPQLDGSPLALPLPDDIYAVRSADAGLGAAWQQWMHAALKPAFAAGYVAVDCARHEDGQWRYLLAA